MNITVAKSAGFCFGVRRAVGMAYEESEKASATGGAVYTMGPIIHNEAVVDDLKSRGVQIIDDSLRCIDDGHCPPDNSVIIVRSHGITRDLTEKLQASPCRIVDATCPFVRKIHTIVSDRSGEGAPIIIIGSPEHPEVQGIRGWAVGPCAVVSTVEEARALNFPRDRELYVVSQTTFNFDKFQELVEIIKGLGYHVVVTNTICNATQERQREAFELAQKSDVMIVIGGKSSSNTQKLYEICKRECKNTYYIQSAEDLRAVSFQTDSCVGITAGASTPNTIIQEVSLNVRRTKLCADV